MSLATADLPADPEALRAFALACQIELAAATSELKAAQLSVQLRTLEIEKLKFQIAKLRRMQFGRSSERIARQIEQLELQLEELETGAAQEEAEVAIQDRPTSAIERRKPKRRPLPDHLPRQQIVHEPGNDGASACPECGAGMARLGEDVTEGRPDRGEAVGEVGTGGSVALYDQAARGAVSLPHRWPPRSRQQYRRERPARDRAGAQELPLCRRRRWRFILLISSCY